MYKAMISGGLTVSAADLIPTVDWALHGFHGPVPANLSGLIAGALVAAVHAGYNAWVTRTAKPVATPAQ
jgi:hypothetical protein